ncbi:MAG: arginine--tRNA ligase [Solitalea-like symbiont of Acarus siro]
MIEKLIINIKDRIRSLLGGTIPDNLINIVGTNKEFKGDLSLVLFHIAKHLLKSPVDIADQLTACLKENIIEIREINYVKGYLNIELSNKFLYNVFKSVINTNNYFNLPQHGQKVLIEISSPNTNKPLHLGHIRNNVLGDSMSKIFQSLGFKVIKTNLVNDRGIHICKSMLAWKKFANSQTPEQANIKGDHFVGRYYVLFETENKKQQLNETETPFMQQAREMLIKWEQKDEETIKLWREMNNWVYSGFTETYKKLNIDFDKIYYESDTYLLGKKIVLEGLEQKIFYQKPDRSIWVDLTNYGLDEKVLLRSDGTSVYLTQDLGTAELKYTEFKPDKSIYVVGSEQDYHFKVLFLTLKKLDKKYADSLYHLSYGMVDLPSGKMKSREGTVVDADDIIDKMYDTAKEHASTQDKLKTLTEEEKDDLYNKIGIGALKYYLLKVESKKRITFNPNEAIDIQGHTGPFIQYTHARITSLLEKSKITEFNYEDNFEINQTERDLIILITKYKEILWQSAKEYNPSLLANYLFELAKLFNKFYHEEQILNPKETLGSKQVFKLQLANLIKSAIKQGLNNLGIEAPDKM